MKVKVFCQSLHVPAGSVQWLPWSRGFGEIKKNDNPAKIFQPIHGRKTQLITSIKRCYMYWATVSRPLLGHHKADTRTLKVSYKNLVILV
jgi:hypothetical protein